MRLVPPRPCIIPYQIEHKLNPKSKISKLLLYNVMRTPMLLAVSSVFLLIWFDLSIYVGRLYVPFAHAAPYYPSLICLSNTLVLEI